MAKPTPRNKDSAKPPKASIKVITEWCPRIGNFLMNATHKSPGGGKMKLGTRITSTRISHRIKSAMKNKTGSAMFFQEDFTAALRADVNGKYPPCQESERFLCRQNRNLPFFEPDQKGPDARRAQSPRAERYSGSTLERADPAQRSRWAFFIRLRAPAVRVCVGCDRATYRAC